MQVICQFLNKLGCVLPSEQTSASIAAAVCVARFGPHGACALPQLTIDATYEYIKTRIKQLYKNKEPVQFIQILPPTSGELLFKYRDVALALYSRTTPPVGCPLNQSAMSMVRSRVSMRGINRMRRSLTGKLMHPHACMCGTTANLRNIYASKYACMQVRVRAAFRGVYRHVIPQFIYRCATCTYTDFPQPTPQPMPDWRSSPQFQPLPQFQMPLQPPQFQQTLSHGLRLFNQKAQAPTAPVLAIADHPANVEPHADGRDASGAAEEPPPEEPPPVLKPPEDGTKDMARSKPASVIIECACMLQAPQYNVVTFAMIAVSFGELRWPPPWGQCDV